MSVFPSTVNPGHFNDSLPTRTPSVSKQHTSLDLNGTVIVEKFVKGGNGLRDPNLTNYIFPSYSAETYYPFRVYRNGVRQTPGIDYSAVETPPITLSPEALDPGEIVTLEYLTNSTELLPTLYPNN
jgi:hypothetical protein